MSDDWEDPPPYNPPASSNSLKRDNNDYCNWGEEFASNTSDRDSGRHDFFNFRSNRDRGSRDDYRDRKRSGGFDRNRDRNRDQNRERRPREGGNDYEDRKKNRYDDENGETLKVPSRCVGRIIGRGGSKINDLQYESGAKITVTKETEGDETIVKISGSSSEIKRAVDLIKDLTVDRPQREESNFTYSAPEPSASTEPPKEINWKEFLAKCDEEEKKEWDKLTPIVKEFYVEHPEITKMTEKEVEEFRLENNNIVVDRTFKNESSKPIPKPVKSFYHAFHNYPEILEEIRKAGFSRPSPIQCQAWPVLMNGEDMIGIAQTGTGKTLAFILPAMIHIAGQNQTREERGGPACLIMAPTRELALQIEKEIKKYKYKGITAVCLYGGGSRKEQVKLVQNGVDIIIATPGRLNDLVSADQLNVKGITYAVLDEADRMLDMGFEPQIRKVMYMIRPNRQTVMTSATWPPGVRRLAQSYMKDPIQVYIGSLDLAATHTVTQTIEVMENSEDVKMNTLMDFISNLQPQDKIIIFCGKKARADELASELALQGIGVQTMHGDREQADREQALLDIKDGTVNILIATDLASRGLDIEDLTHVINYDFPKNIEEYVHRVGRTGRAGKSGQSISYFTRNDWAQAKELISILEEAEQYVPEEIYSMAERFEAMQKRREAERASGGGGYGRRGGFGGGGGRFGGGRRY